MPLGLSKTWVDSARAIGQFHQKFWCPYCGNQQGWGESAHEKEIAKLGREKTSLAESLKREEEKRRQAMDEAEHFRRSRDGMKGVVSKIKKRIGRGVCPCCNRTFADLQRHMQTKHPEVANGEVSDSANDRAHGARETK